MRTIIPCLIYLAFIAAAELVVAFVEPLAGIVFYFVILFVLLIINSVKVSDNSKYRLLLVQYNKVLVHSGSSKGETYLPSKLILALALVPLFRITGLSMPLAELTQVYSYLIVAIPLLVGILVISRASDFELKDIGLTMHALPLQGLIALVGIGLGLIDYLILKPEPLIQAFRWQDVIVPALILLFATGFIEELAFRGVMQRSAETIGSWGWVLIAVLFAVVQIGQGSVIHCLFALLVALLWGWTVKRTGSILGVVLSHGLLNIALYLIFPFIF